MPVPNRPRPSMAPHLGPSPPSQPPPQRLYSQRTGTPAVTSSRDWQDIEIGLDEFDEDVPEDELDEDLPEDEEDEDIDFQEPDEFDEEEEVMPLKPVSKVMPRKPVPKASVRTTPSSSGQSPQNVHRPVSFGTLLKSSLTSPRTKPALVSTSAMPVSSWGHSPQNVHRPVSTPAMPVFPKFDQKPGMPFQRIFLEPMEDLNEEDLDILEAEREDLQLRVEGNAPFRPLESLEELHGILPDYTFRALEGMGITEPMPIQAQALPVILGGHDLIGIAKTGSGKTLAFLLPAIPHMEAQKKIARGHVSPIVLILAPTRELAIQISQEAEKVLHGSNAGPHAPSGLIAQCAFGGGKRQEQLSAMRQQGCHLLVGTPGRLTDFITEGDVKLNRVTYFVLDEADRMLDLGFQSDVHCAAERIRRDRQMLFFSATWIREVQGLATALCDPQAGFPIKLRVGQGEDGKVAARSDVIQEVQVFDHPDFDTRDAEKRECLSQHLMELLQDRTNKILVFVSQKVLADELRDKLCAQGFKADSMHGGRTQNVRMTILDSFKQGELQLLVATDVMGRGLDIHDISHVVNYDMCDIDDYVHRIGRTARGAGVQSGHALTFFEYDKKWPELAGQLVAVMEDAGQKVPDDLRYISQQVSAGAREIKRGKSDGQKDNNLKRKAELVLDGKPLKANKDGQWITGKQEGQWVDMPKDVSGKVLCGFHGSAAGCSRGDKCPYSHAMPESVGLCKFFSGPGGCTYGNTCVYRHPGGCDFEP